MARRLPLLSQLHHDDIPLIRRLFSENAREYLWRYIVAMVAMAVFAATTGGTAWLMQDVVDGIFLEGDRRLVILVPLAMGSLFVLRGLANYIAATNVAKIGNGVVAKLQRRLHDKVLSLETGVFTDTHSADLVTRISHHSLAVREAMQMITRVLVRDFLTLLVLLGVMLWQSPLMSLVVFAIAPIAIIFLTRLVRYTRQSSNAEFGQVTRLATFLQETALGIRIVRAFNLEGKMRERMDATIENAAESANRVAVMGARVNPIMEALIGAAVAGILLWTGYSVVENGASPGAFISFVTALLLAYEPATRLATLGVQLAGKMVGVRLIYELIDSPSIDESAGDRDFEVTGGEIEFDNVVFSYRPDEPLFRGLSFVAEAGKTTALIGPSGVGKTTVIALIERFYEPTAGRILIDGRNIADIHPSTLRSHIAMVGQDLRLFSGTIRDNIRFGRLDATDAEIEASARDAMADEFIRALPDGYETQLGEQGANLSGGQRQRIAIARALLRDAPIVLLDEATSALDSESETKVQQAFDRLKRDRTTIVVAHRLSTIRNADRILVFMNGDIVEQGAHAELLAAERHYARFYNLQNAPEAPDFEVAAGK